MKRTVETMIGEAATTLFLLHELQGHRRWALRWSECAYCPAGK